MTSPFSAKDEDLQFFDIAAERDLVEKEQNQQPSKARSVLNSVIRGGLTGLRRFGQAFGPLEPQTQEEFQQIQQLPQQIEERFPTEDGFFEGAIERGLGNLPLLAGSPIPQGPIESLVRSGLSGVAGQGAQELGFGEFGQAVAETGPLAAPNLFKSKIPISFRNPDKDQLVEFLRGQGLKENQIAPMIQEEGFITRNLARGSPKRGRTGTVLKRAREGVEQLFENLQEKPEALRTLSEDSQIGLLGQIDDILLDMPASQRNKILQDLSDLTSSNFSGKDLINFFQDVNSTFNQSTKQLQRLKEPIQNALEQISPALAQQFNLTNQATRQFFQLRGKLKPTIASDLFGLLNGLKTAGAISTGNIPLIAETTGEVLGKVVARELLVNPRFQNITKRFATSIAKSSPTLARSSYKDMIKLAKKEDPESAEALEQIDIEEFIDSFFNQED